MTGSEMCQREENESRNTFIQPLRKKMKCFFSQRVVSLWNRPKLPAASSVNAFKKRLLSTTVNKLQEIMKMKKIATRFPNFCKDVERIRRRFTK